MLSQDMDWVDPHQVLCQDLRRVQRLQILQGQGHVDPRQVQQFQDQVGLQGQVLWQGLHRVQRLQNQVGLQVQGQVDPRQVLCQGFHRVQQLQNRVGL